MFEGAAAAHARGITPGESERRREGQQPGCHGPRHGDGRIERGGAVGSRHYRKRNQPHERDEIVCSDKERLREHVGFNFASRILEREWLSRHKRRECDREETDVDNEADSAHLQAGFDEAAEQRQKTEYGCAAGIEHPQHAVLEKSADADRESRGEREPEREVDIEARQEREQYKGGESDK